MLDVDPEAAEPLAQVPDVPIGSPDGVVAAQVLLDRLRLGGRLDHHQGLRHGMDLSRACGTRGTGSRRLDRSPGRGRYHRLAPGPCRRNLHGPAQTPQNALVRFSYSLSRSELVHAVAVLTDQITSLLSQYGYAAIFVLMLLESACIPIPSEVTMLFGGALTSAAFAGSGQRAQRCSG